MQDAEIQSWLGSNPAEKPVNESQRWQAAVKNDKQTGESRQKYHQQDTQNSVPALPSITEISAGCLGPVLGTTHPESCKAIEESPEQGGLTED